MSDADDAEHAAPSDRPDAATPGGVALRGVTLHGVTPILPVRSLTASVAHYTQVLGFTLDFVHGGNFASVTRDRCTLFLCQGDQGHPGTWVWIGVADADVAHAELLARGAVIRQPPTNFDWACELQVQDLDGNVLRMGAESKPDVPYGPWLDMHGRERTSALAEAALGAAGAPPDGIATAESPVDPRAHATSVRDAAEAARRAHDLPRARQLYEEALALWRALDDPLTLAHTVRHLGDVLHESGHPALAEPHYVEAIALHRAHPDAAPLDMANAIRSHAVLKASIGDVVGARRLWEEASRRYEAVGMREGVAESAAWSARLAWRAGDLARARDWLTAARAASDRSDDPDTWKFVRTVGLELGG